MKQLLLLVIAMLFALTACRNRSSSLSGDLEITTIQGFPEEIVGCSCYLAETQEDLDHQRFIYLEKYGAVDPAENVVIISLNGEILKYPKSASGIDDVMVDIIYLEEKQSDAEVSMKTGTMTIITKDGKFVRKGFVGVCGC